MTAENVVIILSLLNLVDNITNIGVGFTTPTIYKKGVIINGRKEQEENYKVLYYR